MKDRLLIINDDNFGEEVLGSTCPVLVFLETEWSATCRIADPILKNISRELDGMAKIGKLDVEKNKIAKKLPHHSLPAFLIYNKGEIVDAKFGLTAFDELRSMILKQSSTP